MTATLSWRLAAALGAVALIRPLLNITGLAEEWGKPATPLAATALITLVWIGAAVLARTPQPTATLMTAGLVYAALATLLSGVLSPLLEGELQGPLTNPIALVAVFATNAVWGALAGLVAEAALRALGWRRRAPR